MNNLEPYRRQSRAHTNLLSERPYDQKTTNTLLTLNEGELSSVRPNLYASKGQILYGRYCVITFLYTIMNHIRWLVRATISCRTRVTKELSINNVTHLGRRGDLPKSDIIP